MKALQYITIILFALASVLIGLSSCKQAAPPPVVVKKAIVKSKATPNYSDSIAINMHIMLNNQRILTEVIRCRQKRDECEIKYLRTGNNKYFILGNKYVDSIHYYAKQMSE
jgi:hypothetical protein